MQETKYVGFTAYKLKKLSATFFGPCIESILNTTCLLLSLQLGGWYPFGQPTLVKRGWTSPAYPYLLRLANLSKKWELMWKYIYWLSSPFSGKIDCRCGTRFPCELWSEMWSSDKVQVNMGAVQLTLYGKQGWEHFHSGISTKGSQRISSGNGPSVAKKHINNGDTVFPNQTLRSVLLASYIPMSWASLSIQIQIFYKSVIFPIMNRPLYIGLPISISEKEINLIISKDKGLTKQQENGIRIESKCNIGRAPHDW